MPQGLKVMREGADNSSFKLVTTRAIQRGAVLGVDCGVLLTEDQVLSMEPYGWTHGAWSKKGAQMAANGLAVTDVLIERRVNPLISVST